jgi:hypothetical protein
VSPSSLGLNQSTGLLLVDPLGQVIESWNGLTAAPALELRLRSLLGTPVGMQALPLPVAAFTTQPSR